MNKRYCEVDTDGRPIGFYMEGVNKNIPPTAGEISDGEYMILLDGQDTMALIGGSIVDIGEKPPTPIVFDEETIARRALRDSLVSNIKASNLNTAAKDALIFLLTYIKV